MGPTRNQPDPLAKNEAVPKNEVEPLLPQIGHDQSKNLARPLVDQLEKQNELLRNGVNLNV